MAGKLETPIMTAIKGRDPLTIETVLREGPDLNRRNVAGVPPLMLTCAAGQPLGSLEMLLEHGADVTVTTKRGASCAHTAARHGRLDAMRVILQKDPTVFC